MRNKNSMRGFLMSLEAAFSLSLLVIAASALPAFRLEKSEAPSFFLCTDAALALARSGAFSDGSVQEKVDSMAGLSGTCIDAEGISSSAQECVAQPREKTSLTVPVFNGISVQNAEISCWTGSSVPLPEGG